MSEKETRAGRRYEPEEETVGYEEYGTAEDPQGTPGEEAGPEAYEDYEEYYEEEPQENLADVAERILGARHSRVTTAAPIVTRPEAKSPGKPRKTSAMTSHIPVRDPAAKRAGKTSAMTAHIPVRPRNEDETRTRQLQADAIRRRREAEAAKQAEAQRKKKRLTSVIAAVALLAVLGTAVGIGVSVSKRKAAAEKNTPPAEESVQTGENAGTLPGGSGSGSDGGEATAPDVPETEGPVQGEDKNEPHESSDPAGSGEDAGGEAQQNAGSPPDGGEASGAETAEGPGDDAGDTGPTDPGTDSGDGGSTSAPPAAEAPKYWIVVDFFDRDDLTVYTEATTLGMLLNNNGITLLDGERPSVDLWNDWLASDMTITVDKYLYTAEDVRQAVPRTTEEIGIDTIPRGQVNMLEEGRDGESVMHYTVAYKNGVEFDRRLDWEEVLTAMVPQRYEIGIGGTVLGKDGVSYSYSWRRTCPATYYNVYDITYSGNYVSSRTVATDFNVFPLGTRMYVKNNRYDFGYRVVEDTGTRLDPWQVDIWMPADDPNAPLMLQEGYVYDMDIYVLD